MPYLLGLQLLLGAGATGVIAAMVLKLLRSSKEIKLGNAKMGKNLGGLTGKDGFRISKRYMLSRNQSRENVLCIGATGEAKTTGVNEPNLLSLDGINSPNLLTDNIPPDSSLVIFDPKGTLYKHSADHQRRLGRTVLLYEPLNPLLSICINMLEFANDVTEIRKLAMNLVSCGCSAIELDTGRKSNDSDFINMAIPLLTCTLLYVKKKGYPMNTISAALQLLINNDDRQIEALFSNSNDKDIQMQYNIFKSAQGADRTIGSIKVTLCSNLAIFTDPKIIQTSSKNQFNPHDLRKKPIALYIKYDLPNANYISPLMAVFTEQLFDIARKQIPNDDDLYIFYILEEFQNIGYIPSISNVASTIRDYKGGLLGSIQSISGLQQVYGKEKTANIIANFKCVCILPSQKDLETLIPVTTWCGDTQVLIPHYENNKITHQKVKKPLYAPSDIRTLDKFHVLIIINNLNPVLDKLDLSFENSKYYNNI